VIHQTSCSDVVATETEKCDDFPEIEHKAQVPENNNGSEKDDDARKNISGQDIPVIISLDKLGIKQNRIQGIMSSLQSILDKETSEMKKQQSLPKIHTVIKMKKEFGKKLLLIFSPLDKNSMYLYRYMLPTIFQTKIEKTIY